MAFETKIGTAGMAEHVRIRVASAGGKSTSRNRAHMARIGKLGGKTTGKNKAHMAEIGRKGGLATQQKNKT